MYIHRAEQICGSFLILKRIYWFHSFTSSYPYQGHRGAGAYPSCHTERGGVHPGQIASLSKCLFPVFMYVKSWETLRVTLSRVNKMT